jgi:hypothetical protein
VVGEAHGSVHKEGIVKIGIASKLLVPGLVLTLGVAFSACGDATDLLGDAGLGGAGGGSAGAGGAGTGGSGAGGTAAGGAGGSSIPDGGGTADSGGGKAYKYIVIVDNDKMPVCTGTGPGADIDSVDLRHAGSMSVAGVGLKGSATVDTQAGATACAMCGGVACPNSGSALAERVEGIKDAQSFTNMPDTGYLSLNGGVVWLQIGSINGGAPAQDIVSGDTLTVNEVDKNYGFEGCTCQPEKYSVWAYVDKADETTKVQLSPSKFRMENMSVCGAVSGTLGCGTSDFVVP